MAYVSEYISKEDLERYKIKEIRSMDGPYSYASHQWTIDREKDMWLRTYYRSIDRENNGHEDYVIWNFWWRGYLIDVKTKAIAVSYLEKNKEFYTKYKILDLVIPNEVKDQKEQILRDLKDIFEGSFGGSGVYRDPNLIKFFKVDLEYEGRII